MKNLTLAMSLLLTHASAWADFHKPYFELSKQIKEGSSVEYIEHSGSGQWDNYVTMNLPYAPLSPLVSEIAKRYKIKLQTRGEAHITLITPVEFWTLATHLTISDLHNLVKKDIQNSPFEVLCLGKGTAELKGKNEQAFFLVVKSAKLIEFRKKISTLYIARGGKTEDFNPMEFFPHITLGFTDRDLHLSDGVIKDFRSCHANIIDR